MRYFVNERCIGCGLCANTCPEVFSMTEEGVAQAIDAPAPADAEEMAAVARENCPVAAIEEA